MTAKRIGRGSDVVEANCIGQARCRLRGEPGDGLEEGLYVEPASAAACAAVSALRNEGRIGHGESVVVVLTASGRKDPGATAAVLGETLTVPSDVEAAFAKLREIAAVPCEDAHSVAISDA